MKFSETKTSSFRPRCSAGGGFLFSLSLLLMFFTTGGCAPWGGGERTSEFDNGSIAYVQGDFRTAERHFARVRGARQPEATGWRGLCFLEMGQPGNAKPLLQQSQARCSGREAQARALTGLARIASMKKNFSEAERLYMILFKDYADVVDRKRIEIALDMIQKKTGTPSGLRSGYTVQTGAFQDHAAALALRTQLITAGFDAFVRRTVVRGQKWHVVQAGLFTCKEKAEAHTRALRAAGFAAIVRRRVP